MCGICIMKILWTCMIWYKTKHKRVSFEIRTKMSLNLKSVASPRSTVQTGSYWHTGTIDHPNTSLYQCVLIVRFDFLTCYVLVQHVQSITKSVEISFRQLVLLRWCSLQASPWPILSPPTSVTGALFPRDNSPQNRSPNKGLLGTWRSRLWSRTPTFLRRWMPDSCPCGGNQYSEYYSINTDRRDICHKHRLDKMMSTRVKCHFVNVLYVHVCIIFLLVICRYMINILSELTHTKLGFYSNFMTRNAKLSY